MKQTGRVMFQVKDLSKILLADNQIVLGQGSGKFRNTHQTFRAFPIVGDLVQGGTHDTDHFIIEDVLPRHSFLQRKVAGQRQDEQGNAANIDTVFIKH
jgi:ribosome biogenesis GTPase / thiamine phosphate phosphatase